MMLFTYNTKNNEQILDQEIQDEKVGMLLNK